PRSAAEFPSDYQPGGVQDEPRGQLRHVLGWIADRELATGRAEWGAEDPIGVRAARVERLRDDADEWELWTERVTDGRVVTTRVPPVKALRREPQSYDELVAAV